MRQASQILTPAARRSPSTAPPPPPLGALERLPKWLICVPLVLQWLWLGLRHRDLVLPSAANPGITSGGLVGERKTEYFECMGALARRRVAAWCSMRVDPRTLRSEVDRCLREARLSFPLIAKPDIGWCGFGVRRIDSMTALIDYLRGFPAGEQVILQAYVPFDGEAGVFYVREPGSARGRLTGLALRESPRVTGDGRRTLAELIAADPRLARLARDGLHEVDRSAIEIPPSGAVVRLATIGSTRVGGLYRDGSRLITAELETAIDTIARDMGDFHFGRFDLRFESEESLKGGFGFSIIEVNGAGSEAIEAWDPEMSTVAAFRTILGKQSLLFRIAAANRRLGFRPISVRELARLHLRQQALIPRYPPSN